MKSGLTIILLVLSNIFMTLAWYGHLKMRDISWFKNSSLITVILFSWGLAFFEYCFQVPANKWGYIANGGAFNIWQLKVLQEIISLSVFTILALILFKDQQMTWNHAIGFLLLIAAAYFIFKN